MRQTIRKQIRNANEDIIKEKDILTLLIDANNLLKISLVDKRMNGRGEEYGAVYQFLYQLHKFLGVRDFDYVYCLYDGDKSGQLRYDVYSDYKANRDKHYDNEQTEYDRKINEYCKKVIAYHKGNKAAVKRTETDDEVFQRQRAILQAILEEVFVRQVMCDKVEGDDLIAYYVKNKKPNEKIVIVSGDRDLTQLISDDVTIYIPSLKKYVTPKNSEELLGITHENIVLKKILCGDASDNIKGIKGLGETTLVKLFPKIKREKMTLDEVIISSKKMLEERQKEKKKPLKSLENIVNRITDGIQGENIYEINEKIIDLSKPMLTEDAEDIMNSLMYAPIDPEGRDMKNAYTIIQSQDMQDLLKENSFGNLFGIFEGLIKREKMRFEAKKS
jgi:5'-3' exonuclease